MTCFFVCIEDRQIVEAVTGLSPISTANFAEKIACASSKVKNEFLGAGICDKALILVLVEDARFDLQMFCDKYIPECGAYANMPEDTVFFHDSLAIVKERYASIRFTPSVQMQQAIRVFS